MFINLQHIFERFEICETLNHHLFQYTWSVPEVEQLSYVTLWITIKMVTIMGYIFGMQIRIYNIIANH